MASLGDAIHRPRMLETVFGPNLKDRLSISGPLMLDSGGFTMMMRNGQLSLDVVAKVFSQVTAEIVVSLDYPPLASDSVDERQAKYSRTFDNFLQLHRLAIEPRLAPVIHGVTTDELQANCAAVHSIDAEPAWVCVGGLVPLLRQCGQLGSNAAAAREELRARIGLVRTNFPLSRLHVLGAGSPRTIAVAFDAGADSVDSIGWRRAAGFGTIFMPGGTERFVTARGRKRAASRLQLTEVDLSLLAECGCPSCAGAGELDRRLDTLSGSYLPRAAHNAWVLIGEGAQLRNPP
jgi:tRNA-guanine family transglycosylase